MIYRLIVAVSALLVLAPGAWSWDACGQAPRPQKETGDTYYVSPSGDDSNTGTRRKPWASPGRASRRLEPGDTLVILGGRYRLSRYDEDIIAPPPGRADAWITIRGEEGNRPLLAGGGNLAMGINLSGAHYVRLENLELTHDATASGAGQYFRDGISIAGRPAGNIVLSRLYIHHVDEFGLNFQDVEGLQVLDCRIEYCGFGAAGGPAAGSGGGWLNVLIRGCSLSYGGHYYRGGDGSDRPYDRPDGYGVEHSTGPIEIAYTTAEHNRGDGFDSKSAGTYIHHCVVANNACDGVKLWGDNSRIENCLIYGTGDGVGGSSPWAGIVIGTRSEGARFEIVNVTLHDNPSRRAYSLYAQYDDRDVSISVVVRNSIVADAYGLAFFGPSVNLTAENNIFYRPGAADQVEANGRTYTAARLGKLGPGNTSADPCFVRPAWGADGDYHLRRCSPAIDTGGDIGAPADDLEGRVRPLGSGHDIGAYEWAGRSKRPEAPRKLRAAAAAWNQVDLTWRDRSTRETGFVVERFEPGGQWVRIGAVAANAISYDDVGLDGNRRYKYRVRAVNARKKSAWSNTARARTQPEP